MGGPITDITAHITVITARIMADRIMVVAATTMAAAETWGWNPPDAARARLSD